MKRWFLALALIFTAAFWLGAWCLYHRVQLSRIPDWDTTVLDELAWAYLLSAPAFWCVAAMCVAGLWCLRLWQASESRADNVIRWRDERLNELAQMPEWQDDEHVSSLLKRQAL